MKLGLTQKYLLCILGKKGKVSAFGIEKYVGLTAAVFATAENGVPATRISIYRGKAACQLREGHGIFFDEFYR